jgi:hypothetical protein
MKTRGIISVILLVIFALTLPVALLISNVAQQVVSPERLTDVVMKSLASNGALPFRIREIIWFQSWYGANGIEPGPRLLLTGIRPDQWVSLFKIVFPEKDRQELVGSLSQGIFGWLDSKDAYPTVVINLSPIQENVRNNEAQLISWALDNLKIPQCSKDRTASLQEGNFGQDITALISCNPPTEFKPGVINAIRPLLSTMLNNAGLPQKIDLSEQLKSRLSEDGILSVKANLNRVRTMLPLAWIAPLLILLIGLAITVRNLDGLTVWAGWPLFLTGLIGIVLSNFVVNPVPFLEKILMPPPSSLPAPMAPLVISLGKELFSQAGNLLFWQMAIAFVIGAGLLLYTYRSQIMIWIKTAVFSSRKWFMANQPSK